jgi:hypothetical protein
MKNWTLELENGIVLNVRNIDEEVCITFEGVLVTNLLSLTNKDVLLLVTEKRV